MSRHKGWVRGARAKRTDANHKELVTLALELGASVMDVHEVPGALDLVIGYDGIDQRVEIKRDDVPPSRQKLTPDEEEVFERWRGRKPVVIKNADELMDLLAQMRMERLVVRDLRNGDSIDALLKRWYNEVNRDG